MKFNRDFFYDPATENYLVEYIGDFVGQIEKASYAVGYPIDSTIAVIAVYPEDFNRIQSEIPSIIYIDLRKIMVLQDINPSDVGGINDLKINPYLNLTGSGVTVAVIDTGIDYLNEEFIREDGTTRIRCIWDQTIRTEDNENNPENVFIGKVYRKEEINAAIAAYRNNQDPYAIVPSKDEREHGTQMCSIIGGKGGNTGHQGVATDCEFIIVKLLESPNFKEVIKQNNAADVAVYNNSEFIPALEFVKREFYKLESKAMVICPGIGSTEGSHDSGNLTTRYLNSIALIRGICIVTGTGNEGDKQGHTTGFLKYQNDESVKELRIPREIKLLSMMIWLQKPNKASLNIISPTGEQSSIIKSKINKEEEFKFVFTDTQFKVSYRIPDNFTGNNTIKIDFMNIKAGIWKIKLIGEYIVSGRYDIWLCPHNILPEGTAFLEPNSDTTLTVPSTAPNAVTVAYVSENDAIVPASGKGYNTDETIIKPDIAATGMNITTVDPLGGLTTVSGSSPASAIVSGACALLMQWGIVDNNDPSMYSNKIRSYMIYGATRRSLYKFPNKDIGYGIFNLQGVFNIIARLYNSSNRQIKDSKNDYLEYNSHKTFVRIPIGLLGEGK